MNEISIRSFAPKAEVYKFKITVQGMVPLPTFHREPIDFVGITEMLLAYGCLHDGVNSLLINLLKNAPIDDFSEPWQAQYGTDLSTHVRRRNRSICYHNSCTKAYNRRILLRCVNLHTKRIPNYLNWSQF